MARGCTPGPEELEVMMLLEDIAHRSCFVLIDVEDAVRNTEVAVRPCAKYRQMRFDDVKTVVDFVSGRLDQVAEIQPWQTEAASDMTV